MAESNRDRILPSLLDRLTDEAPGSASSTRSASVTLSELRSSVLRDLNWLFNAVRSLRPEEVEANPQVRNSVLNYGLPALSGVTASSLDFVQLERALRQAVIDFESASGDARQLCELAAARVCALSVDLRSLVLGLPQRRLQQRDRDDVHQRREHSGDAGVGGDRLRRKHAGLASQQSRSIGAGELAASGNRHRL